MRRATIRHRARRAQRIAQPPCRTAGYHCMTRPALIRATGASPTARHRRMRARCRNRRRHARHRRAGDRRRAGRHHRRDPARAQGLAGAAAGEGSASALPHRRIAAADEPADPRAPRRARAGARDRHVQARRRIPVSDDDRRDYNMFRFERAIDPKFGYAFQVKREEFDQLLFEHARANGVDAREARQGRAHRVRRRRAPGRRACARRRRQRAARPPALPGRCQRPRHAVRQPAQAQAARTRCTSRRRSSATSPACTRREGEDAGNITVQRFEHGWMWLIPLQGDVMSVGAVCFPEYLKTPPRRQRSAS